jgi:hypothetical protein
MKISPKITKVVEHYAIAFVSTASGIWYSGDHHPLGVAKAAAASVFGPVVGALIAKAQKFVALYNVGKATVKAATPAPAAPTPPATPAA